MKKCTNKNCNNVAQQGGVCCLHGAVSRAHAKQCSADGCTNTTQRKGLCRYHANKAGINNVAVGATPSFDGENQIKVDGNETELVVAQNLIKVLKQQLHDKNQQFSNCSEQLEAANQEVERYKKETDFNNSALEQIQQLSNQIELKNSALEQNQITINDLRQLLEDRDRDSELKNSALEQNQITINDLRQLLEDRYHEASKDKQQIQQLSNQLQSIQQGIVPSAEGDEERKRKRPGLHSEQSNKNWKIPMNEVLKAKIYQQLSFVVGTDHGLLELYVPERILSLRDEEEETQWNNKKDAAATKAIEFVIEEMECVYYIPRADDEKDENIEHRNEVIQRFTSFFNSLPKNYVFDMGWRAGYGNNSNKCFCPCW